MAYHPLYDGLWHDDALEGAPFEEKAFFVFLWSNGRCRPSGIYRVTDDQLAADAGLPLKRVRAYLTDLAHRLRIVRDGAWLFVRGYFARQPNQPRLLLGVERDIKSCSSVVVLTAFSEKYPLYKKWSVDRLEMVKRPMCPTRPPRAVTASEQLQSSYRETFPPRAEEGEEVRVWATPENLMALYNAEAPDNVAAVEVLSAKRRDRARAALRQYAEEAWWKEVFVQYRRSRFLRGLTKPTDGHASFRPDFDWLLSTGKNGVENYVRVHDGMYAD